MSDIKTIKYKIFSTKNEKDLIKFNNQVKNAKKNNEIVACLIEQGALKRSKKNLKFKDTFKLDKQIFKVITV